MVLTNAQAAASFESATQMAIPRATAAKLREEGIDTVADLAKLDKTSIGQIADNLRRPGGRAADPNNAASTTPAPPFIFGAKSQQRLNAACDMICFYAMIGRAPEAPNLQWTPVTSSFKNLWKSIVDHKSASPPEAPVSVCGASQVSVTTMSAIIFMWRIWIV